MDHANERFSSNFSSSNNNGKVGLNAFNAKDTDAETRQFLHWSFSSLLALQEHASTASAVRGSYKNGEFLPASDHQNSSYTQEFQYGVAYPYGHGCDLYLPPNGTAAESCSRITPQIAPITPEKKASVECRQVAQIQCLSTYKTTNQESNEQAKEIATTIVEANRFRNDELRVQEKDTSSSAVCTVVEESGSPNKGSHVVGVIETPEQKPRRRKHRPKVITESKSKPPRPVTPKQTPDAGNQTVKRKYVRKKQVSKDQTTNPTDAAETPTGKRKYVRQKPLNKNSMPEEVTAESTDTKALEPAKKSCRRSLNFDIEGQHGDGNSKCKLNLNEESQRQVHDSKCRSKSIVTLGHGVEVIVENTAAGVAYDLTRSVQQMLQGYLPEKQAPSTPLSVTTWALEKEWNNGSQESNAKEGKLTADNVQQKTPQITLQTGNHLPPVNPSDSYNTYTALSREVQAKRSKRKLFTVTQQPGTNLNGIFYNALPEYHAAPWLQFPSEYKVRKTEKAHNATTSSISGLPTLEGTVKLDTTGPQNNIRVDPPASILNYLLPYPHTSPDGISGTFRETGDLQYSIETSGFVLTHTHGSIHPSYTAKQAPMDYNAPQAGDLNRLHACMSTLVHETLRTKKRIPVSVASSSTNVEKSDGKIVIYNQNQFLANLSDTSPEVIKRQMPSIEAKDFQHVDIRREDRSSNHVEQNALVPYSIINEPQIALVPYNSDGTIIPLTDSFIKKRRSRAKVDLDDETNKVWKLLMENINNEGIDGTDEEKEKWWEEERNVFRGRANSFIARMHLVQGDRRFSQWKGSVVDSVVGVFLTQNVSDHLSSSAFMSLAARFPFKPQDNRQPSYEERMDSEIDKPIVSIPDLEDATKWNEEISNQSICDQTSMTLHDSEIDEEREVVYSKESSTSSTGIVSPNEVDTYYEAIENRTTTEFIKITDACDGREKMRATNDLLSSQNSVVSSQNSVATLITLTAERILNNNPEADLINRAKSNSLDSCSSFVELLRKAGSNKLHEVHSNCNKMVFPEQRSKDQINTQNVENDYHTPQKYRVDTLDTPNSSIEVPTSPSHNYHLNSTGVFRMNSEETRCSNKTNSSNSMKEPLSTEESASQITVENNPSVTIQVLASPMANSSPFRKIKDKHVSVQSPSKDHTMAIKSQSQVQDNEMQQISYMPNPSEEAPDATEGSSAPHKLEKTLQKGTESDMIEHDFSKVKELDEMNATKRKAKSRRVGNEIRDDVDWDALRKEAEASEGKRERTINTMDSLDWEAVRCANVSEIADTIKERGMNNRLAERIKNFLDRLVKEHGSIDLEWLRDVPPDKAKEYLLSIRGLGLKSVECVRLLTLHHLAFPVDTNVGRIAVRLGWVPLQPLPESLQLHLLELYPVLESIQRYLWPRLCKLDQRTLYELHYQMITFGKVFCTKNKPNCNACPMRGECRHFASAFASARLALPGPEEKGIVSATKNRGNKPNPDVMVGQPLLPLPQAIEPLEEYQLSKPNQQSEARYGFSSCEPIVEEPLSPEIERLQVAEHDMEDNFCEDPDEIPTINLNIEEFTQNLQNYMQNNMELQQSEMSKALVALTAEAASIPMPKLKNVSRLRTEHQVYELPDSHPLLRGVDKREPDDPCSYLLAIWTPGETANSIQPPESSCNWQEYGKLCDEKTCFSCNSIREADSQIVRGTLLIPCRTAMRGSFPLNGTYFQVNEVFADHESSLNPINVPRSLIWNLPRRTVYFGTSIPTIFKGLTTEGIQHCFWKGFVCVRGFDQKTRAPRPLIARLHFPASKLKAKGKDSNEQRTTPSNNHHHIQNDRWQPLDSNNQQLTFTKQLS